jgi:dCMP deaminase
MKQKYIDMYMDWADRTAQLSHARRLQVGAVIVKDDSVISYGYNGMPAGWDNNCEDKEFMNGDAGGWLDPDEIEERWPFEDKEILVDIENPSQQVPFKIVRRYRLKTKPEVLHAESNAIAKLARSSQGGRDADIFITHAPCLNCAKLIYQSGISSVYYRDSYRDVAGIEFLEESGLNIIKVAHNESM